VNHWQLHKKWSPDFKEKNVTILAKVGERTYELPNQQSLSKCREIYAYHTGDQNSLEDKFEDAGVEFTLDEGAQAQGK
jgi:hypothetical protein